MTPPDDVSTKKPTFSGCDCDGGVDVIEVQVRKQWNRGEPARDLWREYEYECDVCGAALEPDDPEAVRKLAVRVLND